MPRVNRTCRFDPSLYREAQLTAAAVGMSVDAFVSASVRAAIETMCDHDTLLAATLRYVGQDQPEHIKKISPAAYKALVS
jgi:hypothetical protein